MSDSLVRVAMFLAVCLAAGMVHGASRATDAGGIARHAVAEFLKLAGGIVLLCVAIWILLLVVQPGQDPALPQRP